MMFTVTERNELHRKWSMGLKDAMNNYLETKSDRDWLEIDVIAACLWELDRGHKKKTTQIAQEFVWEHGYLRGETTYERYYNSGYFKEIYLR